MGGGTGDEVRSWISEEPALGIAGMGGAGGGMRPTAASEACESAVNEDASLSTEDSPTSNELSRPSLVCCCTEVVGTAAIAVGWCPCGESALKSGEEIEGLVGSQLGVYPVWGSPDILS